MGEGAGGLWGARGALAGAWTRADAQAGVARAAGGRWVGARGRARGQARAPAERAGQGCLGARAGLGLCTRCTRPVFGPVRLGIFLSQNFWTLFVNPVHEHCSSQNFSKKFFFFLKFN